MAKKTKNLLSRKFRAKPKPVIPLGPYTKPRVTAVKLDPGQAVLSACVVGGGYLNALGTGCAVRGGATRCALGVRGIRWHKAGTYPTVEQPS